MDLREFMSVRRAYNIVRQMIPSDERLTFEEFAILCRLDVADEPINTSAIAEYQGALRPTMTHRTNHLANLGFINRGEGEVDRRNVVCTISDAGRENVAKLSSLTRAQIPNGKSLSRTSPDRIRKYVDAMGSVFCKAGDLVLLGIYASGQDSLTIMQLVEDLGLLQPTVSMSVSSLADMGLVERSREGGGKHTTSVGLSEAGKKRAEEVAAVIEDVVVRRKVRKTKED